MEERKKEWKRERMKGKKKEERSNQMKAIFKQSLSK